MIDFDPARHCGGTRRSDDLIGPGRRGEPCRLRKGAGTDHRGTGHCKYHLGSTRNGQVEAAKERAAVHLARLMGIETPSEIDGREAIAELVSYRGAELKACAQACREAEVRGDAAEVIALKKRFDELRDKWLVESKADADVRIEGTKAEAALRLADAEMLRSLFLGALEAMAARIQLPPEFLDRIQPIAARDHLDGLLRQARALALEAGRAHAIAGLQALAASTAGGLH